MSGAEAAVAQQADTRSADPLDEDLNSTVESRYPAPSPTACGGDMAIPNEASREEITAYLRELASRVQLMTASAERFVYFSGLIAIAAVKFGVVDGKKSVIILAPYALAASLTYQIQLYTDVARLRVLKELIETLSMNPRDLTSLERFAFADKYRNRASVIATQIFYLLTFIIFIACSLIKSATLHWHDFNVAWFDGMGIALCLTLIALASIELARSNTAVPATLPGRIQRQYARRVSSR
ncbi:hypothetical protein [Streptomyces pseudovenezuelae]|uniref:hypothetical protein n=1 Tax=Streptomyces pseudovenezuelae TaxID=67350 RepID=UPI002E346FD5|nr:hypothetical protein [Streptomyces pseudovenezuelae]